MKLKSRNENKMERQNKQRKKYNVYMYQKILHKYPMAKWKLKDKFYEKKFQIRFTSIFKIIHSLNISK